MTEEVEVEVDTGAVVYTDGGCMQKEGYGGWGFHGYLYSVAPPKKGSGNPKAKPTAVGYKDKKPKGGEKDHDEVSLDGYVDGWGSIIIGCTNNVAEMLGTLKAIEYIKEQKDLKRITFILDSKYVLNGVTKWMGKWAAADWIKGDGSEIANKQLWIKLKEAVEALQGIENLDVHWEWVKGHSGNCGNDLADRNATRGLTLARFKKEVERTQENEATGYWKAKIEINRLISLKSWYFNTNVGGALKSKCGRNVYHLGDHGGDDELLGKRISDAAYCVLFMNEQDPVMEKIRQYQDKLDNTTYNMFVVAQLDNLLKPATYVDLHSSCEEDYLFKRGRHVTTLDGLPVTVELKTPRLAFNAAECLSHMESMLDNYLSDDNSLLTVTDVTEVLYDIGSKGKAKLKKEFDNTVKSFSEAVKYDLGANKGTCDLTLSFGIDLPRRNTLSAIAEKNPKVKVITWRESDTAFRYATIVEVGDDAGIWAGAYRNLRLLN